MQVLPLFLLCLAPNSSQYLSDAVGRFNQLVPAEDSIKFEDFLSSAISQGKLSEKLDNQLLSSLMEASTVANKARLLSVSLPHAASWLSMPPCERQGLHLEPSQFQVAVKWWLGLDTLVMPNVHCVLKKVSILLAIMPQHASVVGMLSIAITGFGTLWPSPVAVPILVSI